MEGFSTQIERASILKIEIEDIERMRKYQFALVDLLLYDCPKNKKGNTSQNNEKLILNEIRSCERWLKNYTAGFVNDKNRKLIN